MRASVRLGWQATAVVAFAATAALAVTLSRGAPMHAALTSAKHTVNGRAANRPGASGTPQCAASRLRISVGPGTSDGLLVDRAVTRYRLEFTNVSGAACTLSGYPEVAAYRDDDALAEVGNAAGRDTSVIAHRILLAPGATAHAAVIAAVAGGPCRPVTATGLRVVPPGQPIARYVPHALRACSAAGPRAPVFLHVRALQPGTGTMARQPRPPVRTADMASHAPSR
jgi:Protein of unknown function (DUF4232)